MVINAVGLALWLARSRVRPHPAFQALLAVSAVGAIIAIVTLDRANPVGGPVVADAKAYVALAVFPILMLVFWLRERWARNAGHDAT